MMENKEVSVFVKNVVLTKKIYKTKNDITKHPLYKKLALEFHPILNGDFKLSDFSIGSGVMVHWKCYSTIHDDHEWYSRIADRFENHGCSVCAGRKVVLSNCL